MGTSGGIGGVDRDRKEGERRWRRRAGNLCHAGGGSGESCVSLVDREIVNVPLCGAHAREQEARLVMGDLAQDRGIVSDWEKQDRGRHNEPLQEILGMVRLELDGRITKQRRRVRP